MSDVKAATSLLAFLFLSSLVLKLTAASYNEDLLGSPLDFNYVFNDLDGSLFQDFGFPQIWLRGLGDPQSKGTKNGGGDVAWNLYSNNAGDAQYHGSQSSGLGKEQEHSSPQSEAPYRVSSGQEPPFGGSTFFQPLNHIYPFDDGSSDHSSPSLPPQQGPSGLSSIGRGLSDGHNHERSAFSSLPEAQYLGAGTVGEYQPAQRQILPDPYSGLNVPYSPKQPKSSDDYLYTGRNQPYQSGRDFNDDYLYTGRNQPYQSGRDFNDDYLYTGGNQPYQNGRDFNDDYPYTGGNQPYQSGRDFNDDYVYTGGKQPYQSSSDFSDDALYTDDEVYDGSHSGVQNPQGSYHKGVPTKGLSDVLFPKNSFDAVAPNRPVHSDGQLDPYAVVTFNGAHYPNDHVGGGGSVVGSQLPYPVSGGVGGQDLGGVAVGGGGGGGYVVVPHHSYPTDVQDYRNSLQCWPQFFLQYDHDFTGAVWQDVKGEVLVQQGRAVFKGQGFLAIPFFACNDLLPRYSMIFVISPSYYSGGQHQAVLGNSVYASQASLLVSLWDQTLTLVVRQRAPGLTPEQLLQQCNSYQADDHHQRRKRSTEGNVLGSYGVRPFGPSYGTGLARHASAQDDIVVLQLRISGEVIVTIAQENDWIFFSAGDQNVSKAGRLPTLTNEALYVGAGADPRGGSELAHYTGTFDNFLFEKCS